MRKFLLAASAVCVLAQPALATFDLQITEIWPGQGGGNDVTDDWFEITNFGDMAWEASTHGGLWFDDESMAVTEIDGDTNLPEQQAVPLEGITTIAAGESVIFVEGDSEDKETFETVWGAVVSLPQVGYHDGSGLSGNGDAVTLFLDADLSGDLSADADGFIAAPDLKLDFEDFPEVPLLLDGSSYDVVLQEYSTVGIPSLSVPPTEGAVATLALGGDELDTPAVGTPGFAVPEPGTIALLAVGMLSGLVRRK